MNNENHTVKYERLDSDESNKKYCTYECCYVCINFVIFPFIKCIEYIK